MWHSLPEANQVGRCQTLDPYVNWVLFKEVEAEFLRQYGPLNALTVTVRRRCPRVVLPRRFLGFPVLRVRHQIT